MAKFEYRYNEAGDAITSIQDFTLNAAYAAVAAAGDLVKLNASDEVVAAAAADAAILGVFEGFEIAMEAETAVLGKVRTNPNEIFLAEIAGTPSIGNSYDITATNSVAATSATPAVKVVKLSSESGKAYVKITGRQL